ncbi:hypothetical protein AQUCO_01300186v1 [Aquilegia coerulea]|uniref:DYW domain-containing protein n=1 Tax=Aquilegia coerulea TaxID=218851 RepID=A0A2G5E0U3_AQUCA|nr:hypothetical protein AQUCO_01300186v1 [Aquilegia coerulea]
MSRKQKLREAVDLLYTRGCSAGTEATYTKLLLECVQTNDVVQAKRLQNHMDLHNTFKPNNTFLQNRLLHLYAKSGKVSDAQQLFDKMPQRDVFSWNAMLSSYSKLGLVQNLKEVFDSMPVRDSVSYNTIIAGFVKNECFDDALSLFIRMQREEGLGPSDYTLVSVLNACSHLLKLKCGKQVHGRIIVSGNSLKGKENIFVWNALIDMYAKCGEVEKARWLFDRIVDKNVVSWNSMVSGYLKNGQPKECLDLYHEMQLSAGINPDLVTVSSILGACFQIGLLDEATRIFRTMKDKDKVFWTTMIVGFMQNRKEEDALMLFREMLHDNVRPDSYTLSSIVSVCARLASLDTGKVVHGKAVCTGFEGDLLVSSTLIDMYSKSGEVGDAWIVFEMMPVRNVVSWNAMIVGYAQNGKDQEALALYNEMLYEGLKPDNITFVGVLSACGHTGLIEQGWKYFRSISELHGSLPTLDHYACMINLLGRSGHMKEAVELIKSMQDEPNHLVWSTLLSASKVNRDIEHAEMAASHLFKLDPLNAEPYIMLSNMYAASGRWEAVASMRSLMKDKKIQKFAAYSWIEIDNEVHMFVSDDRTHPQTPDIYKELSRLIKKMREAGYISDINLALHDVGDKEKTDSVCYHSEKLALAFGLIRKPQSVTAIRILKNIRVCGDCHMFMKFVSKIMQRPITLRDSSLFHHFVGGQCSCKDYW